MALNVGLDLCHSITCRTDKEYGKENPGGVNSTKAMVRFPDEFSNERYAKGPSCELTSLTGLLSPGYTEENNELFQPTVNTSTCVCLERYICCEGLWCLEVYPC
jgi:hypothetical protein